MNLFAHLSRPLPRRQRRTLITTLCITAALAVVLVLIPSLPFFDRMFDRLAGAGAPDEVAMLVTTLLTMLLLGVSAFCLLLSLFLVFRLLLATHAVAFWPTARLDERQRAVRDLAVRRAYGLLMGGLAGTLLLVLVGTSLGAPLDTLSLVSNAAVVALVLPTLVLAWLEPDPLEDEPLRTAEASR